MKFFYLKNHWALLCLMTFLAAFSQSAFAVKDDEKIELANGRTISAGRMMAFEHLIKQ